MSKHILLLALVFSAPALGMVVSETDSEDMNQANNAVAIAQRNAQQKIAFLRAVKNGETETCREMLRLGINPNTAGARNVTALHGACFYGYPEIIRLLIQGGATVTAIDDDGNTPLHYLLQDVDDLRAPLRRELLKIAVEMVNLHGADMRAQNGLGVTPLYARGVRDFAFSELLHKTEKKRRRHNS